MDRSSQLPDAGAGPLVQVHVAGSVAEAHVVSSVLNAEEIPAVIFGIEHATMVWDNQIALGGLGIIVPAAFADAARTRLREVQYQPPLWESAAFWRRWYLYAPFVMMFGLTQAVFVPWVRPNAKSYFKAMILLIISLIVMVLITGYIASEFRQTSPALYSKSSD